MSLAKRSLFVIALLFTGFPIVAHSQRSARAAKKDHSIFWQITKAGSADTSYLFGTLHLLEQSYVDTMPSLMRAVNRADVIVGEIVVDSSIKDDLFSSTTMKEHLSKLMSKKDFALVNKEVEQVIGMPITLFDQFRPVVIYAMLLEMMYQKAHPENHKSGVPMDIFFQNIATKNSKKLLGLETVEDQENVLFDSTPVKKQIADLVDLVKHKKKAMTEMDQMLKDYANGDVENILVDPDMQSYTKEEMDDLLYKRNRKWLQELPTILDQNNAFIAVGAGHLVGKKGLVEGLRKLGYTVSAVSPL